MPSPGARASGPSAVTRLAPRSRLVGSPPPLGSFAFKLADLGARCDQQADAARWRGRGARRMLGLVRRDASHIERASEPTRRAFLRLAGGAGLVGLVPPRWLGGAARAQGEWASGGTAAMTAKASYPDPVGAAPGACALVAPTTQGPCTTAGDLVREDISEGWRGLPVRLALRVVDTACQPLRGATVRIWHTNREGSYSGQTPANAFCLLDQTYAALDFFRGVQTTGDDGVVSFDTCFPGWYRGRAIHIHFQVVANGVATRVSQLFFAEDLAAEVFATHPDYTEYGQPDTPNAADGIFQAIPVAQREALILDVARMPDDAMLASKTVAVATRVAPVPTATATVTPAPSPGEPPCAGDCNGDGAVTVDELVTGVSRALGETGATACAALDLDGNGTITVDELLTAVNRALSGCVR